MKSILITVPDSMKAQLDAKRVEGYSLNGYVRAALHRALKDQPPFKRPRKKRRAKETDMSRKGTHP